MTDSIRVHPWAVPMIRAAAVVIAIFVGVASFILSFTALSDVAVRAHVPADQAWLWPCTVDGATLLATLGVVVCRNDRKARRFFWSVLIGGLLVSIGGNDLHAILPAGQDLHWVLRALVGAVAPVSVVVSIHGLTILMAVRRLAPQPRVESPGVAPEPPLPVTTPSPVRAAQQPDRRAKPDAASDRAGDDRESVTGLDYDELAAQVLQLITVKDIDTEQVCSVLEMSYEHNLPNRDIGRRLGMRHHTVGKIVDASAQVLREHPLAQVS